jgi:hypothetical protein
MKAYKVEIKLLINNVSENRIATSKTGVMFYLLNGSLRSESVVYKAEVAIFYKALSFRKLKQIVSVMYPYAA